MIRPIDNNSSPIIYINTINNAFFHLSIIFMSIWIFLQRLLLLTRSMPICLRMESHRYVSTPCVCTTYMIIVQPTVIAR